MNDFVNKWFPPQKPNLVAKYDKDFIPPKLQEKRSMDKLKEIDRKLGLLPEYLAYRAEWMSKYGPVYLLQQLNTYGILYIVGSDLLSFDMWVAIKDNFKNETWVV